MVIFHGGRRNGYKGSWGIGKYLMDNFHFIFYFLHYSLFLDYFAIFLFRSLFTWFDFLFSAVCVWVYVLQGNWRVSLLIFYFIIMIHWIPASTNFPTNNNFSIKPTNLFIKLFFPRLTNPASYMSDIYLMAFDSISSFFSVKLKW